MPDISKEDRQLIEEGLKQRKEGKRIPLRKVIEEPDTLRASGQLKDGKWLVLTESQGKEGKGYTHACGESIMGKVQYVSIHDGPFPLSGFGEVRTRTIPYCPKCEYEPADTGVTNG